MRIEESIHALHVNMRTGTVMSLLNTATGVVFAAHLPSGVVARMLEQEAVRLYGADAARRPSPDTLDQRFDAVRRRGLARAVGKPIPGINAISAPVFDFDGRIVLAITALGPAGTFDAGWDGDIAAAMRASGTALSRRLGGASD